MNIAVGGMLSGSLVIGGLDPGTAVPVTAFVSYVNPLAATLLPNDTVISDVAPRLATLLPNDAAISDTEPFKAAILN